MNALATYGYLFVSHPLHLFFVQAGLGLANVLATPTWEALYAKYEDKKHDGYVWGLVEGQRMITTSIAIIIGGLVVTYVSFTALFILMGIIQTIATIYQAQILSKK